MGKFLEDLKKAVDDSEFNSEAAKKIIEIDKLADEKADNAGELIEKRLSDTGVKTVTEEEAIVLNSEYEKKMEEIKKQDVVNNQLVKLLEIEDMIKLSVLDMTYFIDNLENKFKMEFETKDPMFSELSEKIEQIKSKYNFIINN
jgi:hypothetical protein